MKYPNYTMDYIISLSELPVYNFFYMDKALKNRTERN